MANMHLVTGYAGQEHVTAADQGVFHSYLFGADQFVFDRGNKLAANIESNNLIRVLDGDIYIHGRHVRLNEGTYVDLPIENGEQGVQRHDLIVARYTKDSMTSVEEVNLVVIKGTAAAADPADPEYTDGDILEGALLHDMPLYRVPLDGLNVGEPIPLFNTFGKTIPGLDALLNTLDDDLTAAVATLTTAINGKAASSHEHAAGDITSGILSLARGGTGASVSSIAELAAAMGAAKIESGLYTATNSTTKKLTFSFNPKVVLISGGLGAISHVGILVQGAACALSCIGSGSGGNNSCDLSWGTNTVTITGTSATYSFNYSSWKYGYCAIG